MPLTAGTKLAHYEIVEPIGKGGMGEVYRAKDSKLGRDVAIKVLPDEFAQDEERLRRFQREAKVLAALNHPNIASIYGVEQSDDTHYLVLELVPGETLAERIARGPIPVDEALEIAAKIAEALEEAHEQGIVHRDLKPANIKVTQDDKVKVLDFGLAKALVEDAGEVYSSTSPTLTRDATRAGVLLGTAGYMSPEQARARPVDRRTDIWAFGCVLYEMLAGREAFPGESVSDVLAGVLTREPDWAVLPTRTPFLIERLLCHCLQKERRKRIPDIGVATIDINDALTAPTAERVSGVGVASPRGWLPWVVAGVMTALTVTLAILWRSPVDFPRSIRRFEILPSGSPSGSTYLFVAVSPDGTRLVYPSWTPEGRVLMVRRFDELVARPLSGTEGGNVPFFSSDGDWVGFKAAGHIKKVPVNGGVPVTLCVAPQRSSFRISWSVGGDIISGGASMGLWRVSEAGGEPEILSTPDQENGELDWHSPHFLPGGESVLFSLHDQNREFRIEVFSLLTRERTVLIEGAFDGVYVPTGHIVYGRGNSVLAVPFDLARLEITGPSVRMLENVNNSPLNGLAAFSVGADGTLVYAPAPSLSGRELVWVSRDGSEEPLSLEPQAFSDPRLSPRGDRIAVAVSDGNSQDIWVYDLNSDSRRRVTFEEQNLRPVWSPDGTRLAFGSNRSGKSNIYVKSADGGGTAELLLSSGLWTLPDSWAANGDTLAFAEEDATEASHIGVLHVQGGRSPQTVLEPTLARAEGMAISSTRRAQFSPDGRFIAYQESGEIHVRPFPEMDASRWQLSTDGGREPIWGRDGRELYYRRGNAIIAVPIVTKPAFQFGPPRELFRRDIASRLYFDGGERGASFDVAPDGRFLVVTPSEDELTSLPFYVVENWFEELKARVPADD